MALGAFVFSERLQRKQLAGIAPAIIGVLVLIEASLNGQHIAMSGFMLTLAAAFSWACGNIFNKKIMQHSPRPGGDVAGGLERADPDPAVPAVIAATGGADHITQSLITIDMTTILSLLYLAFVATILGYGIWGALLGRYETARGAVIIAGAGSRAGERRGVTRGNVDRDAACGRSTDYGWTLYQCVWISCAPYCACQRMRHYVTKKTNANFRPCRGVIAADLS